MSNYTIQIWETKEPSFELTSHLVHIWSIPLNIEAGTQKAYWHLLSNEEKFRANRFKFEVDKIKYIACRGALRVLLSKYLVQEAEKIEILYLKNGKPNHNSNLEFNVSHSGDWAVIGFTLDNILGIDIEYINREIEYVDIASKFFSAEEAYIVINAENNKMPLYFYNCWTRKEAFIKAIGDGLSFPLNKFRVSINPKVSPKLLVTNWDPSEANKWSLWSFTKGDDYIGAVTVKSNNKEIQKFSFNHSYK